MEVVPADSLSTSVRSIFVFELRQNTLVHVQTLQLAGSPLDVAVINTEGRPLRLAVAADPDPDTADGSVDPSLVTITVDNNGRASAPDTPFPMTGPADAGVPRHELDKLLYAAENLRKTEFEDTDDGERSTKESAVDKGEGAPDPMDVSGAA